MNLSKSITLCLTLLAGSCLAGPETNRITVDVRGKGPDVILIPGGLCSNAVWAATAKRFEKSYRLHLVQVAGFAGAPAAGNANGAILEQTVTAIHDYIKTNRLQSPKVIGHSIGGLMGMMLAIEHPQDLSKLMVVDALPFFSVIMGATDVKSAQPGAAQMRDQIIKSTPEEFMETEKQMLHMMVKSPDGFKQALSWAVASDKAVSARAIYEDMITDLRPKLAQIKTPVTMLYPWDAASGFSEPMTDNFYQQNFSTLPDKHLVRIDGSYHFIMLDQPEKFATEVEKFLK